MKASSRFLRFRANFVKVSSTYVLRRRGQTARKNTTAMKVRRRFLGETENS